MHIKYRPKTLDEVIGNRGIKKSISNMELNRPILFEGETGSGKTTFAYIIARNFAVEENIIDLNCVHFSRIEEMREIITNLQKSSIFGREKVLILDEIHELSPKSQQVLLKPLEHLSDNILVIACTTTTANVKNTLLDRFIRFKVKPFNKKESKQLIDRVSEAEGIKLSKAMISMLIEKSDGIPRRILTGLAKLRGVDDEEEAQYLLELNAIEASVAVFDLFKLMIYANTPWIKLKKVVKTLLNEEGTQSVRVGLLKIASGRLLSDSYGNNANEIRKLNKLYKVLRHVEFGFMEKEDLVFALHKFITEG